MKLPRVGELTLGHTVIWLSFYGFDYALYLLGGRLAKSLPEDRYVKSIPKSPGLLRGNNKMPDVTPCLVGQDIGGVVVAGIANDPQLFRDVEAFDKTASASRWNRLVEFRDDDGDGF